MKRVKDGTSGSEGEGTGCGGKGYWEAGLSPGRVLAGCGQNL